MRTWGTSSTRRLRGGTEFTENDLLAGYWLSATGFWLLATDDRQGRQEYADRTPNSQHSITNFQGTAEGPRASCPHWNVGVCHVNLKF